MADWKPNATTVTITQISSPPKLKQDGNKCEECGATENLWLNLSDGRIFCGQPQRDGSGGKGHAKQHFEKSGNKSPLVVKIGTISPKGADVVSYAEGGDLVEDLSLKAHLAHFGLDMAKCKKTEKTLQEMEFGAK